MHPRLIPSAFFINFMPENASKINKEIIKNLHFEDVLGMSFGSIYWCELGVVIIRKGGGA